MKKTIFMIVIGYLFIAAIVLMVFDKDKDDDVYMLTVIKPYARMLTLNETIDIPFYITNPSSFIIDETFITHASITSLTDETTVNVVDVIDTGEVVDYASRRYYKYYLSISLDQVYSNGLKFHLDEATLNLTYENDVELNLDIGSMDLMFDDLTQPAHIDFRRMYSIHEQDAMTGIYIELINKTSEPIQIMSVDCLYKGIQIDLNAFKYIYDTETHILDINAHLPDFQVVVDDFSQQAPIPFNQDMNIVLPIQHLHQEHLIHRFPIIIEYQYHEQDFTYIIDDYLFFDVISDFYKEMYPIETHQYHHQ